MRPTDLTDAHQAQRRTTLKGLAGAMAAMTAPALIGTSALAQEKYPNRPITLIAPLPLSPPGHQAAAATR